MEGLSSDFFSPDNLGNSSIYFFILPFHRQTPPPPHPLIEFIYWPSLIWLDHLSIRKNIEVKNKTTEYDEKVQKHGYSADSFSSRCVSVHSLIFVQLYIHMKLLTQYRINKFTYQRGYIGKGTMNRIKKLELSFPSEREPFSSSVLK